MQYIVIDSARVQDAGASRICIPTQERGNEENLQIKKNKADWILACRKLFILLGWAAFFAAFLAVSAPAQKPPDPPASLSSGHAEPSAVSTPCYGFKIVNAYPHDPDAFTEGLVFEDGFLFESTGLVGKSTIRKVDLKTGKVLESRSLEGDFFGEGLACWQGKLIQLTWKSGIGFVYDRANLETQKTVFRYKTEGWGITSDGKSLIMSDGTAILHFMDPEDFTELRQIEVKDRGVPVLNLNELEYIKGEIFANIWREDKIARISPETGRVLGWIDLGGLRNALGPVRNVDVLNGIAYDPLGNRLFVTGKLWPLLFEIELVPIKR